MPLAAEILQNPGLEHLLLECLERPVQAIAFFQRNLDHCSSEVK
jgi:hypothetical protein